MPPPAVDVGQHLGDGLEDAEKSPMSDTEISVVYGIEDVELKAESVDVADLEIVGVGERRP